MSTFCTREKEQELISIIKAEGSRRKGFKKFAEKYGINEHGVRTHFYKHMLNPELDRELPRGKSPTRPSKFHSSPDKPPKPYITVEQTLRNVLEKKNGDTPLTKEDIETAAQNAGVHYHVALSTWANMIQKGEAAISNIQCTDNSCLWLKGMAFMSLLNSGVTVAELARASGLSPAEIRELAKTCQAFPDPEHREPSLSFYHHRIAANTDNPHEWIKKAKEAGWSTRDFKAAVNGEPLPAIAKNTKITVGHILNLTTRIAELEQEIKTLQKQLQASKKISLAALQLLHSKNKRHLHSITFDNDQPQQTQVIN